MAVGSNGHVAWGFTNSYGDFSDLIILEVDPKRPGGLPRSPGARRFTRAEEVIEIKGASRSASRCARRSGDRRIDKDHLGRPSALAWTAHRPQGVNSRMTELENAHP